nr:cytochrome P450 81D11-like [Ipomoea batatas]
MNLSLISSRATREVWLSRDWRRVTTLFLGPTQQPLIKSTVVVTILTSTGNCEGNSSRMPGTNTSNLTKPSMGFTGKTSDTPTCHNTFITLTLSDTNNINHLILLENSINGHLLLKETICKVNFLCYCPTINLDFHHMSLLLLQPLHLPYLVLVKPPSQLLTQMLSPNSVQASKTTWCFHIANNSNNYHRRCFNDGHSLTSLFLVKFRSWFLNFSDNEMPSPFPSDGKHASWEEIQETHALGAQTSCETSLSCCFKLLAIRPPSGEL